MTRTVDFFRRAGGLLPPTFYSDSRGRKALQPSPSAVADSSPEGRDFKILSLFLQSANKYQPSNTCKKTAAHI